MQKKWFRPASLQACYPQVVLLDTGAVSFKYRSFRCPEGTIENSPAFQRWADWQRVASPEGTAEVRPCTTTFSRPFGTCVQPGYCGTRSGLKYALDKLRLQVLSRHGDEVKRRGQRLNGDGTRWRGRLLDLDSE